MIELGLTADERELAADVDEFARSTLVPIAEEFGEQHAICRDLVAAMADRGYFGLNIASEYGGRGNDHRYSTVLCILREHLGYHEPGVDFTFGLQGLGTVAIVKNGDDAQRSAILPDLVDGTKVFAFAVTEPGAGSDVRGMTTTATPVEDGYRITGTKTYISGAPDADLIVVVARTPGAGSAGYSAFIVDPSQPGVEVRQDIELGAPHSIGTIVFTDHFVPSASRIGAEGDGLKVALGTLEVYRPSVGALAVGMTRSAYDHALAIALEREVGGRRLADLEVIRLKLARMWADATWCRALVYRAAATRDAGESSVVQAAMSKLAATEAACRAVYESQQIHGARGVTVGYHVEALARHARQATIYEGTSEIQRLIIGRSAIDPSDHEPAGPTAHLCRLLDIVRSSEPGRELLASDSVRARLADVCIAIDAADLVAAQVDLLTADDDRAARFALVAELTLVEATDLTADFVTDLARRSPDVIAHAAADDLRGVALRASDVILLDLADVLW
jgi:alkylation response protein AidB-like acyl-CoA dehydrogenase